MRSAVIGTDTLQCVREQTDIVALIGESVRLTARGRSHVGLCPFHKEKSPSFHVNPERGFYHCFGCSVSGDAIKFLQEFEGLSFLESVRQLAERAGIELKETAPQDRKEEEEAARRRQELYEVSELAAAFYEKQLTQHCLAGWAQDEIGRRELSDAKDTLSAFRVGYAPYAWDGLAAYLKGRGASLRAAEAVGLLVPKRSGSGYVDRFRHRLMFAVQDLRGRVVAFSGRMLESPTPAELKARDIFDDLGEAKGKYINSPESPIYRKRDVVFGLYAARQAIRRQDQAVLVEGNFDVVSLHARGIAQAVAPLGTAFTAEQARLIRRYTPHLVLLFDGDAAGKRAVTKAREAVLEAEMLTRVAAMPEGTDPDTFVREKGQEALVQRIASAKNLLEYLLDDVLDGNLRADSAHTRAAKIHAATTLIASEPDPTVRALAKGYADTIAQRLGIADATSFRELSNAIRRKLENPVEVKAESAPHPERARSRKRARDVAFSVIGALLDCPDLLSDAELEAALESLTGGLALAVAALRQLPVRATPEEVLARLPEPIHAFATCRLAAPEHDDSETAKRELLDNVKKLRNIESKREEVELVEELQKAAASGDVQAEEELLREHGERAKLRHGLT